MHEVMHRVVEHRAIVVLGQVPEDGHRHEPEGRGERMRKEREQGTRAAAREQRRESALAQEPRQPGGEQRLRQREEKQHRAYAAKQQMLHLMHGERMLGERVDRRLQGSEQRRQPAEEAGVPPSRRCPRPIFPAPPTVQIKYGDKDARDQDVGRERPACQPFGAPMRPGDTREGEERRGKRISTEDPCPTTMTRICSAAALLLVFLAKPALGHVDGTPPAPHDLWSAWTLDPLVVVPLAVLAALYAAGASRRRRTGRGRQAVFFWLGMVALSASLVWPLDALGEALLSGHMAQHLVLLNIAAPLLALGAPGATLLAAISPGWRCAIGTTMFGPRWRTAWRWLTAVSVATVLQQVALWSWHAPPAIALSLQSDAVHALMHVSLLAAAFLFWATVLRSVRRYGASVAALLITAKLCTLLGALLIFARSVAYPAYAGRAAAWGFSPLEDQQLAGLLMMPAGGIVYVVAAVIIFGLWLGDMERRSPSGRAEIERVTEEVVAQKMMHGH